MKKYLLLILAFSCSIIFVQAQDKATKGNALVNKFHSFNTVQLLNGNTTTSLAINTVNGFQFGKLFTGIGTGFDYYYHTSVPLFLEARFNLIDRKNKLQLFSNGGLSFPFSTQNKKFEYNAGPYKTGSTYGAGLDYLITVGNQAFILGVAFSNKQVIQMVNNYLWNPLLNKWENIPTKDIYSFNRIAIRLGWMF
ncbi:MAG: hypothetical protein H7334_08810 [Ferruginibacter sp.]|nr:hypothetical protein [Ferruginibacter sp.]